MSAVSSSEEPTHSAAARRDRHARAYLCYIQPLVLAIGLLLLAATSLLRPGSVPGGVYWASFGAAVFVLAFAIAAASKVPIRPLMTLNLWWTMAFFLTYVPLASQPDVAVVNLTYAIALVAYFGTPRTMFAITLFASVVITIESAGFELWELESLVPPATFALFATGIVLTFVTAQGRRTERELDELVHRQSREISGLERVERSRARLIANVSHELRTPLTTTLGFVDTLRRDDLDLPEPERRRILDLAHDGALRLQELVNDLLELETISPEQVARNARPVSATELCRHALIGLEPPAGRAIQLIAETDPYVLADGRRIEQVLVNLVTNAIRHGEGRIDVELDTDDHSATIRVRDDGPGIPPAREPELFRPFARFSSRTDSTGLGLAISRVIAEAHEGSLSYRRRGGSTCFELRLPLARG